VIGTEREFNMQATKSKKHRTHWAKLLDQAVFNAGADARLRGVPRSNNPERDLSLRNSWAAGWDDVDQHWGEEAKNREELTPLPAARK